MKRNQARKKERCKYGMLFCYFAGKYFCLSLTEKSISNNLHNTRTHLFRRNNFVYSIDKKNQFIYTLKAVKSKSIFSSLRNYKNRPTSSTRESTAIYCMAFNYDKVATSDLICIRVIAFKLIAIRLPKSLFISCFLKKRKRKRCGNEQKSIKSL